MSASPPDAIVLQAVAKRFKKTARKREYTTFKSELVAILKGERRLVEPPGFIEALAHVDLRIPKGATVGIIGRNGSGKSTLLKLITGIYTPSAGRVEVNGRISALLELGAGFHPDFTGRENILINGIILGMNRAELKARMPEIIDFAELGDFIDEPVRTYSSGMFMRLAFAVATHVDPEILIVDEILAVGDEHFGKKSHAKMTEFKASGKTIVLVTHALATVESWCDSAAWLDGGRTRMFGKPQEVVAAYREAVAAAEAQAASTGHSALSVPGLALPEPPPEPPKPVEPLPSTDWKSAHARWHELVWKSAAAKSPERRARFETSSGIARPPVEVPEPRTVEQLGFPGEYPFTRGVQPTMYRGRFWTMRQYAGFGSARDSNQRYHALLQSGQTGLSVAFDLPTQMGFDADNPRAKGEVGKVGVSIGSVRDMALLLEGLPLGEVSTSMTINATAPILLCLYAAVGERQGVPMHALQGTVQNDILKEYIARGTYIYPPGPSLRLVTNLFAFCAKKVPRWNPISISGYHIREAGSTAAQEIGFTLADGIAYVDAALAAGLQVDEFAGRLSFFFNVHNDFLEEIAKFRAARRLWARVMKERFKAQDPRSMMLRFHAQTAGSTLTAQQPMSNVVRVSLQALAAVLGGTQSLHTNSWDEALALPTEDSARLALRTQQIIAYETGVADAIDPLGGSYHLERLTDELESRAEAYLKRVDELGGMVRAIEQGYPQQEIQHAAYTAQRAMEQGDAVVVGMNKFATKEPPPAGLLRVDEAVERAQVVRLAELKKTRHNDAARRALDALKRAAGTADENLIPFISDAVRAEASLGEISDAMRAVFGVHHEQVVL